MKHALAILLLLATGGLLQAQPVPPTTAYSRYFLTSTNQNQAQTILGVTPNGVGLATYDLTSSSNLTYQGLSAAARQGVTNAALGAAHDATNGIVTGGGDVTSAQLASSTNVLGTQVTNGYVAADTVLSNGVYTASTNFARAANNLASGTVAPARLGAGTTDGTTYLRSDGTWQPTNTFGNGDVLQASLAAGAYALAGNGAGMTNIGSGAGVAWHPDTNSLIDGTLNLSLLYPLKTKIESNLLIRVMVIGDSYGANDYDNTGPQYGVVERLVQRLGLNGSFMRCGNWIDPAANSRSYWNIYAFNGSSSEQNSLGDGTVNDYYGYYTVLSNANWTYVCNPGKGYYSTAANKIGVGWLAWPNGGSLTVSNQAESVGSYSRIGILDGFNATPIMRYTNFSVALDRHRPKVITLGTETNKLIGMEFQNTNAPGVVPFYIWHGGVGINTFSNSIPLTIPLYTNFSPDLVIFNFLDYEDFGSSIAGGTTYSNYLVNAVKQFTTNCPNAAVIFMGVHWAECVSGPGGFAYPDAHTKQDNTIIRGACLANHWVFWDSGYIGQSTTNELYNIPNFFPTSFGASPHMTIGGCRAIGAPLWDKLGVNWPGNWMLDYGGAPGSAGYSFPTNYTSDAFTTVPQRSRLVVSNNYLYFVTPTKTNLVINGN